jgi:hypothetical protein
LAARTCGLMLSMLSRRPALEAMVRVCWDGMLLKTRGKPRPERSGSGVREDDGGAATVGLEKSTGVRVDC